MKAIILVAGEGKRLRPLTYTRPKHLLPIAGKPLLEHTIQGLKENGINEFILVIGYEKEFIKQYFKDGAKLGVKIEYILQDTPLGTAHAAGMAENHIENDFILIYGDILVSKSTFKGLLEKYRESNSNAIISLKKVNDPEKYGIINLEGGVAKRIIEKPKDKTIGNLANAGIYILKPSIFEAIKNTKKSKRGEFELTDSLQMLIDQGEKIYGFSLPSWWLDVGRPWDLLKANKLLMDKETEYNSKGEVEEGVHIRGNVKIGKNTIIRSGSYLKGPVIIGDNCQIGPNCYIRDYTTIGNNIRIGNACEIKGSIIMDNTNVSHLSYVGDSIIGENCNLGAGTITANLRFDKKHIKMRVKKRIVNTGRKKLGMILGDNVQTGIGTTLLPGIKVGNNSVIGPNINIWNDIPPHSKVILKEKIEIKKL
ncbi:MAG: NTP transferase domain-containing protein [Candidatus Lokiarchaeota archaeon]|nr:NTP transferase domain-containing protein [Candidatus Lokiarchaeota archaeon]